MTLSGQIGAQLNRFDAAFDHTVTLPDASTLPLSFPTADDVTDFFGDNLSLGLPGGICIDGPLSFANVESTIDDVLATRLEVAASGIETTLAEEESWCKLNGTRRTAAQLNESVVV